MKKILSWFLGCLALATMTTCNNEKYLPIYTIEGKLYSDCGRVMPVRNATIQAIQVGEYKNVNGRIILGEATTDSTGYFKLDYKIKDSYAWASYELIASGTNLYKTLKISNERIEHKGDLFVKSTSNLKIILNKAQNTFTANDTLYYSLMRHTANYGYEFVMQPHKPTPITNLQNTNEIYINNIDLSKFSGNKGVFYYGVGLSNYAQFFGEASKKGTPIQFTDCNKNQQITIDLP